MPRRKQDRPMHLGCLGPPPPPAVVARNEYDSAISQNESCVKKNLEAGDSCTRIEDPAKEVHLDEIISNAGASMVQQNASENVNGSAERENSRDVLEDKIEAAPAAGSLSSERNNSEQNSVKAQTGGSFSTIAERPGRICNTQCAGMKNITRQLKVDRTANMVAELSNLRASLHAVQQRQQQQLQMIYKLQSFLRSLTHGGAARHFRNDEQVLPAMAEENIRTAENIAEAVPQWDALSQHQTVKYMANSSVCGAVVGQEVCDISNDSSRECVWEKSPDAFLSNDNQTESSTDGTTSHADTRSILRIAQAHRIRFSELPHTSQRSRSHQKHKCTFCDKVLGSSSALQIHIRSHTGERPYVCTVCGSKFSTKGNLKSHGLRHTQQTTMMHESASTNCKSDVNVIVSTAAADQLPGAAGHNSSKAPGGIHLVGGTEGEEAATVIAELGQCAEPAQKLVLSDGEPQLEQREEANELLPVPDAEGSLSVPSPVRPIWGTSPLIDKDPVESFEDYMEVTQPESSKLEMLVRNIDFQVTNPNQCVICRNVLSCKSALQMHYRTHTGEKPYKCKMCGRAFTTKGNLKTHMKTHKPKGLNAGRLLHECPICRKQFSNMLVLAQHLRAHSDSSAPSARETGRENAMVEATPQDGRCLSASLLVASSPTATGESQRANLAIAHDVEVSSKKQQPEQQHVALLCSGGKDVSNVRLSSECSGELPPVAPTHPLVRSPTSSRFNLLDGVTLFTENGSRPGSTSQSAASGGPGAESGHAAVTVAEPTAAGSPSSSAVNIWHARQALMPMAYSIEEHLGTLGLIAAAAAASPSPLLPFPTFASLGMSMHEQAVYAQAFADSWKQLVRLPHITPSINGSYCRSATSAAVDVPTDVPVRAGNQLHAVGTGESADAALSMACSVSSGITPAPRSASKRALMQQVPAAQPQKAYSNLHASFVPSDNTPASSSDDGDEKLDNFLECTAEPVQAYNGSVLANQDGVPMQKTDCILGTGSSLSQPEGSRALFSSSEQAITPQRVSLAAATAPPTPASVSPSMLSTELRQRGSMDRASSQGQRIGTTCDICSKVFPCRSALEIHYRSHTKEKPFKCELCEKSFTTKGNMKQHMQVHMPLPVSWSTVAALTGGAATASQPATLTMSPILPIASSGSGSSNSGGGGDDGCGGSDVYNFQGDSATAARLPLQKSQLLSKCSTPLLPFAMAGRYRSSSSNRHCCSVCKKTFSSTSALHIHLRTHTGDRPFKCTVCLKAFATKGNLKVHVLGKHPHVLWPKEENNNLNGNGSLDSNDSFSSMPPRRVSDDFPLATASVVDVRGLTEASAGYNGAGATSSMGNLNTSTSNLPSLEYVS